MPGTRLDQTDRYEIARRLKHKESYGEIGLALDRPKSTISREVRRNGGRELYNARRAQARAEEQAKRPQQPKLLAYAALAAVVLASLERRWSPAQVAGRLRWEHPAEPAWRVAPESIYRALYDGVLPLSLERVSWILRSGKTKRQHSFVGDGRGQLKNMTPISERPAEVDERHHRGHWEGDLIVGPECTALLTLVERVSRYALVARLPRDRTAATTRAALTELVASVAPEWMKSITWDQGKEMAEHTQFSAATGIPVFFCEKSKPWQRGTNEFTNRLIRQYFPKGTCFAHVTEDQVARAIAEINQRPRRCLNYATPHEIYTGQPMVAMTG